MLKRRGASDQYAGRKQKPTPAPKPAKRSNRATTKTAATPPRNYQFISTLQVQRHLKTAQEALHRLWQTPIATLLTMLVIAIALALPATLFALSENVRSVSNRWDSAADVLVFLHQNQTDLSAAKLANELRRRVDVSSVRVVTRAEAREEFVRYSGMGSALDLLEDNPFPPLLIVSPKDTSPNGVARLRKQLSLKNAVDQATLDSEWLAELTAIIHLVQRTVVIIGMLLGLAVIINIGNTLRLDINNRQSEIVVMKLVGADDSFVRRPFLYTGLWYGIFGGILALLLLAITLQFLSAPFTAMVTEFSSTHNLHGLGWSGNIVLLGSAILLGWAGAWLAVGRHLKAIEPQ